MILFAIVLLTKDTLHCADKTLWLLTFDKYFKLTVIEIDAVANPTLIHFNSGEFNFDHFPHALRAFHPVRRPRHNCLFRRDFHPFFIDEFLIEFVKILFFVAGTCLDVGPVGARGLGSEVRG